MKNCLLGKETFDNDEVLKQHYQNFHNIDKNNYFFQKFFSNKKYSFLPKRFRYLRCDEFLAPTKSKTILEFLKHYTDGKSYIFEDKPIDIKYPWHIKTYQISLSKHGKYCNFEDAESLVNDFLNKVSSKFKPTTQAIMKCGFYLENLQALRIESSESIINVKYWSTDPYQTTVFNDHIFLVWKMKY